MAQIPSNDGQTRNGYAMGTNGTNGAVLDPSDSRRTGAESRNGIANDIGTMGGPVAVTEKATQSPSLDRPPSPNKKQPTWVRLKAKVPGWVITAWHNPRQWEHFARTMVAMTAMMILMCSRRSLERIGSAAFFGLVVGCMCTASMPLSIYVFLMITMCLGMLLGWAWGVAAWAAGLSVRSDTQFHRVLAEQKEHFWDPSLPMAKNMQRSIFRGAFLDPRSSTVTGAFLFIGAYGLGWVRAKRPKLIFLTIFGVILMDMATTFGPLFPMRDYMLPTVLIKPAALMLAIGLVCTIVFFPQSLSYVVLGALTKGGLGTISGMVKLQEGVLTTAPSHHKVWAEFASKATALRKGFVSASATLMGMSKLLQLEISHGRIDAGQLSELVSRTQTLGERAVGLTVFVGMVNERHKSHKRYMDHPLPHHTKHLNTVIKATLDAENTSGHSLDDLIPDLKASTADLRKACEDALDCTVTWLNLINTTRWTKAPPEATMTATRDAAREYLKRALDEYRTSKHFQILDRFEPLFDPVTGVLKPRPEQYLVPRIRGMFRCFVFTSALISFAVELVDYLEFVHSIEMSCPTNRWHFPGKFLQSVYHNANDSEKDETDYTSMGVNDPLADRESRDEQSHDLDDDVDDDIDNKKRTKRKRNEWQWRRDPDARYPKNVLQKFWRLVHLVLLGMIGPNGLFAMRYAIVSIALWIPAVCPNSARFYYENRGLWALIMAQTGLGVMAGEQLLNMVVRIGGTCFGAAVGIVCWYIGAQKGRGNPYGIVVATMVGVGPLMWLRIAAPKNVLSFWIITCVTCVFVVGYSWVDSNLDSVGNPGYGGALAGKRALLVIIGFVAGFIINLLPWPVSAKKLVREGVSKNIAELGTLYGLQYAAFEMSRSEKDRQINVEERRARFRDRLLKVEGRMSTIESRIGYASIEWNAKGEWPKEDYEELLHIQSTMLASYTAMSAAYAQLSTTWLNRLTDRSDISNPTFTADCFSLFSILRHSLRNGVPLPPTIPIFDRLMLYRRARRRIYASTHSPSACNIPRRNLGGNTPRTSLGGRTSALSPADVGASGASTSAVSVGSDSLKARGGGGSGVGAGTTSAVGSMTPLSTTTPTQELDDNDDDDDDDDDGSIPEDEYEDLVDADWVLWAMFKDVFTWKTCHDEQFAIFATATIAHISLVGGLNTMHSVILDLVGERGLHGFDVAQDRWAQMDKV